MTEPLGTPALPPLEELFAEADRIGAKYQTTEEINQFQAEFSQAVAELEQAMEQTDRTLDALKQD